MKYNFPKVPLNKTQVLWLKTLYEKFKRNEQADPRAIKAELDGQIPRDFDGWTMLDSRLASAGRRITLLGIWHVDRKSEYLELFDATMKSIREILLRNPSLQIIPVKDVSSKLGKEDSKVKQVIELLRERGSHQVNLDMSNDTVAIGGEPGFDFFYQYADLTTFVKKEFAQKEQVQAPRFDQAMAEVKTVQDTAFILMSMNKRKRWLQDVYDKIKDVCETFGIKAYRVDDVETLGQITDEILKSIQSAQYIIADLSEERPNVYYEIGYAKALGKDPILLKKKGTIVHFDLYVHKATEYEYMADLKRGLTDRLEKRIGKSPRRK